MRAYCSGRTCHRSPWRTAELVQQGLIRFAVSTALRPSSWSKAVQLSNAISHPSASCSATASPEMQRYSQKCQNPQPKAIIKIAPASFPYTVISELEPSCCPYGAIPTFAGRRLQHARQRFVAHINTLNGKRMSVLFCTYFDPNVGIMNEPENLKLILIPKPKPVHIISAQLQP